MLYADRSRPVNSGVRRWRVIVSKSTEHHSLRDYPKAIGSLNPQQRLRFYEVFAHNLTVCVRAIWSDDNISDAEKVDRLKWVNDILHRITGKIGVLRFNLHEWTESDTWGMIQGYVEENRNFGGDIGWAIKTSYESIVNNVGRV